ncbi:hypothetical protein VMT65_03905 [Nocardia sp. CDC153]|uniref:hypothetical protein n=1 Tax=Nocardia sp. CDC153 TaxID=3112167 RepID=UPI002DB6D6DC|nr:hypothetical protein [Nocardia sp. CDC153]MEC3952171.1 hypothetical protein [Nocardia sp. CDC153]
MRRPAEELDSAPGQDFDPVGTVEMALSGFGAYDFHASIEELARAAAEIGGDYFYVTDFLGPSLKATAYQRKHPPRSRMARLLLR